MTLFQLREMSVDSGSHSKTLNNKDVLDMYIPEQILARRWPVIPPFHLCIFNPLMVSLPGFFLMLSKHVVCLVFILTRVFFYQPHKTLFKCTLYLATLGTKMISQILSDIAFMIVIIILK